MKFIVDHLALRSALALCGSVIEKRSVIPILAHVRIETKEDAIELAGTDSDVTVILRVPAVVAARGSCTIDAETLSDVAKGAEAPLSFSMGENRHMAIVSGSAKCEIPTRTVEDFPTLPDMEDAERIELAWSDFMPLLRTVDYAEIRDYEIRFSLKGVLVKLTKKFMDVCACDGHRMALARLPGRFDREVAVMLPAKLVKASERLQPAAESPSIALSWNASHASIASGDVRLFALRNEVRFLEYESILPKPSPETTLRANTQQLAGALRRVAPFTSETSKCVALAIHGSDLLIESRGARPERGNGRDSVEINYDGDPTMIGMNAAYLIEALSHVATKEVLIQYGQDVIVTPYESTLNFTAQHLIAQMVMK